MHFGIKGMHWGVRKSRDSGGSGSSSAPKQKMSTKKKVLLGVGAGIAVGAATAAFILAKRGGIRVPKAETIKKDLGVIRKTASAFKPLDPSPFQMRLDAGMAAHRNAMDRVGAQQLTDKLWRDAAKVSRTARENAMKDYALNRSLIETNAELLRGWRR